MTRAAGHVIFEGCTPSSSSSVAANGLLLAASRAEAHVTKSKVDVATLAAPPVTWFHPVSSLRTVTTNMAGLAAVVALLAAGWAVVLARAGGTGLWRRRRLQWCIGRPGIQAVFALMQSVRVRTAALLAVPHHSFGSGTAAAAVARVCLCEMLRKGQESAEAKQVGRFRRVRSVGARRFPEPREFVTLPVDPAPDRIFFGVCLRIASPPPPATYNTEPAVATHLEHAIRRRAAHTASLGRTLEEAAVACGTQVLVIVMAYGERSVTAWGNSGGEHAQPLRHPAGS